jgi:hypothetical protein
MLSSGCGALSPLAKVKYASGSLALFQLPPSGRLLAGVVLEGI